MKQNYQNPTVEVVPMIGETRILSGSQSYPSGAPINAQRNGYGDAISEDW